LIFFTADENKEVSMPTYGFNTPGEGGVLGTFPEEVFWPDSATATAIGALDAKEDAEGRLVKFSTSAARTVIKCDDGDVFHARILRVIEDDDHTYELTCRVYCFPDKEGNLWQGNNGTDEFPVGTNGVANYQEVLVDGSDWTSVKGTNSGGTGSVQEEDSDANYCRVRF
jgi:hypothetical protein